MKAARPLLQPPSFMEIVMTTNILQTPRLQAVNHPYDPGTLFRVNINITPAPGVLPAGSI
jgi:hypothetical protein